MNELSDERNANKGSGLLPSIQKNPSTMAYNSVDPPAITFVNFHDII